MQKPAIPANEELRLKALDSYKVLDSPEEQGFDDIAALAAEILGTPIALVSLVDSSRQWFKAHHGLDATETPREFAFCAHAILQDEPFVIPDSLEDPRFRDNPLVTHAPRVRFYAGTPLINQDGYALGTLCVIDHTPRAVTPAQLAALKRLGRQVITELELRRARDNALRAAAAKSELLTTMSHEIRTPLNGVLGMTELALQTSLNEEQRELIGTIHACGEHLLAVINNVLDFSKLDSGRVVLERMPMDIKEMFTQIRAMFAASADARGVELKFEFDPAMKVMRLGDPTRLRQAIINLVGNGLKFTTQGSVQVLVQAASGPDEVLVSVKDTGIGIAAEHIPGLFSRFSQADATTARRFGGSGLGLAITRRLIELMGGQIGVDSQVGAGSTFWFRVALPPVQPAVVPEREANAVRAEPVTVAGLKLLVAEDNAVNIMLIARLLKRFGCEVTITETGRLAVEAWNRGTFDAVFMDCQMPDMDGFEATRRIRESGARGREVPIIALTASAMDEDRERCVLAGMSEFLCKPVVPAELESMLKRVRRLRERDAADDCAAFADVLPELRRATP